jgi:hypothetical protein
MNHPCPTLGYHIESGGCSICYLAYREPCCLDVWREGAPPGRMDSIRDERDRRHAEFMQDVDIAIHEAQHTPEEYPDKRLWGHSTYAYVVSTLQF